VHEALLYGKRDGGRVDCALCMHLCSGIAPGESGKCEVRQNIEGELFALSYGMATSITSDPIEKKPVFHYHPGSRSLSLGSVGCNFKCEHCQNWSISQVRLGEVPTRNVEPQWVAQEARRLGCPTISWTYNEPTVWYEFTLDAARYAHEMGIPSVYVTNGYMSARALKDISPYLGAFRVDVKSFDDDFYRNVCGAELKHVLARAEQARRLGIHVEVVNLLIGGLNDGEDETGALAEWVHDKLGEDTPLHITGFHPDNLMLERAATPLSSLERASRIAREAGLRYVYLGNVGGHEEEDTRCPKCGELLISRSGFSARIRGLTSEGMCQKCGERIPVKGIIQA